MRRPDGFKQYFTQLTFTDLLGRRLANFFAAASIEAAAPSNSFSAITVGSSGSTQSVPASNIMSLVSYGLKLLTFKQLKFTYANTH
jgi:hypothetical protein